MLYLVIFLVVSGISAVLFFLEIKCVIKYKRNENDDNIVISFYTMKGIFKYKYEIPLVDLGRTGVKFKLVREVGKKDSVVSTKKEKLKVTEIYDKYITISHYYHANKKLICDLRDYIKTRVVLAQFSMKIIEGTENASHTGIICGFLWSAAGLLSTALTNTFKTFKKCVAIKPNYYKKEFTVDIFCIFHVKLVHIIVMVTKIYFNGIREKKKFIRETGGGLNDGASDRRTDDDGNGKYQGNG